MNMKTDVEKLQEMQSYAAQRFGVLPGEVLGYNWGCAYDKVWVTTRETAESIARKVEGETCNGGRYHGMPLGGIEGGDGRFEVMC